MDLGSIGRHALGQSVMGKEKGEVCVVWCGCMEDFKDE